ncbi:portal protein [Gordonia phage Dardanus]|uniref:Portal protein n=1 Tax=Gordonia phage Dardanus TaxID=2588489 RepID=A0A514CWZ9_9CAUD|nr:portal protein [Gordonia phage Dardanus]QDH85047.1 portal protein [Gordonia phage Dardanus]
MGIASWLGFRPAYIPPQSVTSEPILELLAAQTLGKSPEELWREQPYLRMVVTFLARNVAQLGLHLFEFGADDSRVRVRGGAVAGTLKRPNPQNTTYDLILGLVSDLALYDNAYLMMMRTADSPTGFELRRVPPRWVTGVYGKTAYSVEGYQVTYPNEAHAVMVPAENMLTFHGWNPDDTQSGVTPIEALKSVLHEQISAQAYRRQLWDNGGRVGTYLTRPKDAPPWSNQGRTRFKKGWAAAYTGNGKKVGGVPVLEDGMEMKRVGFASKEEEYVEGTKLALSTVAGVYHINPTMLGLLDNANYSNVREFRRGLYGDTLGPIIAMIEARLNAFLMPFLGAGEDMYVEFNIREKLEGSFEEQGNILYQAAGGPYMTRNEVRARQNLPRIEGGDVLIVPMNLGTPGDQGDEATEADEPAGEGDPAAAPDEDTEDEAT